MQGLGGTGAQVSEDCSFGAGTVAGAPLRISWFLVIFFIYQLIEEVNAQGIPLWVRVVTVTGNELILLLTVLCHEMGHGSMARRCGGEIAEVLLWPFGGICFTTRPQGRSSREKLVDDLWIVGAGPATHFPQAGVWLCLLGLLASMCSHVVMPPAWKHLIPFSKTMSPCLNTAVQGCFHSWLGYLSHNFLAEGIQINVMLFVFNVFFPMYPMDGAKLIVCSLQLFCRASARCAAKVLIYTSTPLAVLFIVRSLMGWRWSGGGMQAGITAYLGIMCLTESYKIYKLMQEERLYTHPLFELARSSSREVTDTMGTSVRINTAERDDPEAPARPQAPTAELRLFSGAGQTLAAAREPLAQAPAPQPTQEGAAERQQWLDRMERDTAERGKTVRELVEMNVQHERGRLEGGKLP